jgi:hypothetical protein
MQPDQQSTAFLQQSEPKKGSFIGVAFLTPTPTLHPPPPRPIPSPSPSGCPLNVGGLLRAAGVRMDMDETLLLTGVARVDPGFPGCCLPPGTLTWFDCLSVTASLGGQQHIVLLFIIARAFI